MSTSKALANLPDCGILDSTEVRSEFQRAWDQISEAQEEAVFIDGLTQFSPSSPRSFRTENVDQAELSNSGHVPPRPAAGSYARHWTLATGVQRQPQNSRLLSLPAEILDHIIDYVVGHNVLHVDDAESVGRAHGQFCDHNPDTCAIAKGRGPRFQLSICVAPVSEERAYADFRSGYEKVPALDHKDYYVDNGAARHNRCLDWRLVSFNCMGKSARCDYAARLRIFHVCSELSLPAFKIFWATTTFSFVSTVSFGKFLSALNDTQMETIKKINLNFDTAPGPMDFDPCRLMKLHALDTLNLCLHSIVLGAVCGMVEDKPDLSQLDFRKQLASDILQLEVLDIKRVNVIVYDSFYDYFAPPGDDQFNLRFTVAEKHILAGAVRDILKAPKADREALAREDRLIFELEELVEGLRFARDVRWQQQRRVLKP